MAAHFLTAPRTAPSVTAGVTASAAHVTPQTRIEDRVRSLIDAGFLPVPSYGLAQAVAGEDPRAHGYQPEDFRAGQDITILLGAQPNGRYKYILDLDSHTAGQDADAARAAFERALPQIAGRIRWARSKSGRGWHGRFESARKLSAGPLFDTSGRRIGDLLGKDGDRIRDPGDLAFPFLGWGDVEALLALYAVRGAAEGADTWTSYAKAGGRYTHGWERERPNLPKLSIFLETYAGEIGARLARLRTLGRGERSEMIARLAQTVLLHVHKLGRADFFTYCQRAKVLILQADAYGKADERTYNHEKDVDALIAKIVSGAPRADGYSWAVPFWAKGSADTPAAIEAEEPQIEPRRPGRPVGSGCAAKRRAKLRKILLSTEADGWGRILYHVDDLAAQLKTSRRSVQADLKALRDAGEISTGQIGGNGRPYAVLTSRFGCANNPAKPDSATAQTCDFGGAIIEAVPPVETLQTDDRAGNAIEEGDHQDYSAPTAELWPRPAAPAGAQPGGALPSAPAGATVPSAARRWRKKQTKFLTWGLKVTPPKEPRPQKRAQTAPARAPAHASAAAPCIPNASDLIARLKARQAA